MKKIKIMLAFFGSFYYNKFCAGEVAQTKNRNKRD